MSSGFLPDCPLEWTSNRSIEERAKSVLQLLEPADTFTHLLPELLDHAVHQEIDEAHDRNGGVPEKSDIRLHMIPLVGKPDYIGFRRDQLDARFGTLEGNFDVFKHVADFKRR